MPTKRPAIFSHSLQIATVGTARQLIGLDKAGNWVILAQLPAMSDARALLVDRKALARALQFNLIDDLPAPQRSRRAALTPNEATALKLLALLAGAIWLAVQRFLGR